MDVNNFQNSFSFDLMEVRDRYIDILDCNIYQISQSIVHKTAPAALRAGLGVTPCEKLVIS